MGDSGLQRANSGPQDWVPFRNTSLEEFVPDKERPLTYRPLKNFKALMVGASQTVSSGAHGKTPSLPRLPGAE